VNTIRDKHGREYRIVKSYSGGFDQFRIEHNAIPVGYVNCHFEDAALHIDDLRINDKVIQRSKLLLRLPSWIGLLFATKRKVVNYQSQGLGTAMIDFLASYARKKSAKRLEGEIRPFDFKNNPQLPAWYRRRGFIVTMGEQGATVVAKISFTL
jgi:hypothetical protein